ncbi:glycosyltransferase family 4 protein [Pseudomonas nitroreducens]|uniref:glycosyltransferase family 4 protein n=1 Tax=Pseudomonas nitroreducens TaxID=46680 RepID=UPI00265B55E0|nr:glycosyltransferase family 4 protein [Pseudomonas nitroreducens]MCP1647406.1 glycosyltransferase involved in cell wall biosynthesis [Pseudomonas nitroreducens]MCP1685982.1 glycosyltransferase involved in cell wall biosynthesis [Pseudomonas nitroreducens]
MSEKQKNVVAKLSWWHSFPTLKSQLMARIILRARYPYRRCISLLRGRMSERHLQLLMRVCERIRFRLAPVETSLSSVPAPIPSSATVLPDWIVAEMRELSVIEPAIYPLPELLADFHCWIPPADPYPGQLYQEMLCDFLSWRPQIVFLIPHLMRGGADLGTLHHLNLCCEAGLRVTVVITRDVKSAWRDRIPNQARVVEFGQLTRYVSEEDRRLILLRLLLQSTARRLHLINSELGWQLFELFGRSLVSEGIQLFASVYCDDINSYGVRCSYSTEYLPRVWQYLSAIVSDNRQFLKEIQRRDGLPAERMHALYFPSSPPIACSTTGGQKVLWASRMTAQKRPELLLEIVCALPDVMFEIFGEADSSCSSDTLRHLASLANVRLGGSFDSFTELAACGNWGLFLYTSAYDGLPNVLLEATVAGLPVVAETVGGVGELIDSRTGFPLSPGADCAAYVARIREVLADPVEAMRRVTHAQDVVRHRHAWESFHQGVRSIPGYWPIEDGGALSLS